MYVNVCFSNLYHNWDVRVSSVETASVFYGRELYWCVGLHPLVDAPLFHLPEAETANDSVFGDRRAHHVAGREYFVYQTVWAREAACGAPPVLCKPLVDGVDDALLAYVVECSPWRDVHEVASDGVG